jgi:hypothetical protein
MSCTRQFECYLKQHLPIQCNTMTPPLDSPDEPGGPPTLPNDLYLHKQTSLVAHPPCRTTCTFTNKKVTFATDTLEQHNEKQVYTPPCVLDTYLDHWLCAHTTLSTCLLLRRLTRTQLAAITATDTAQDRARASAPLQPKYLHSHRPKHAGSKHAPQHAALRCKTP